jgi:hypothetical protein
LILKISENYQKKIRDKKKKEMLSERALGDYKNWFNGNLY